MSILGNLWARLTGGGTGSADSHPAQDEPVEHAGYVIRPAPFQAEGQYQIAGVIEKPFEDGVKTHSFIRADRTASREEAVSFTVVKAKQLIDQQGDRIFDEP